MNSITQFKATIGLDWADQKHDLWIRPAEGAKADISAWSKPPKPFTNGSPNCGSDLTTARSPLGIETSRGPVISALMAYDFIVLFPVNPKALKDYRAAFSVSGAKDDRTDAQLLEELSACTATSSGRWTGHRADPQARRLGREPPPPGR